MSELIKKLSEDEILSLALKRGNEEMFKLLTDNPEILKAFADNVFGSDIVEMVLDNPERIDEFKELLKSIKDGSADKIPDHLKN